MGELTRTDLDWALKAVLPHVGRLPGIDTLGLKVTAGGNLHVWATDRYTLGIAWTQTEDDVECWLPVKEAVELERYVRPQKKADQDEPVTLIVHQSELHVQLGEQDGVVFETVPTGVSLDAAFNMVKVYDAAPHEYQGIYVSPELLARFAKAQRSSNAHCRLDGVTQNDFGGGVLVRVGDSFIGAVRGTKYELLTEIGEVA